MEEEIKSLIDEIKILDKLDFGGKRFYQGTINNIEIVLVKSGVGKVDAGATASVLVSKFQVDALIHSGSAGGIGGNLKVGDIVVSSETAYHDVDLTPVGCEYGAFPDQLSVRFKADEKLIDNIMAAGKQTDMRIQQGLIVSGDQFIASKDAIDNIMSHFPDALCCEMEGAAIGQIATQFKIPFVVVRSMSDVGNETANLSFEKFVVEAGKRSATMLLKWFNN